MATTRNADFQTMLNEYLPNSLLFEETIKRDWFLSNLEVDNSWQGSKLIVPFKGAGASSVEFGQLAGSSDISQSQYVRGHVDSPVEVWSSLIFNHSDLMDHSGKIPESTFLKILPNEVDMLADKMKQVVSTHLGTGSHFATFTANGTAGGVIAVDHIDRFDLGQKLEIDDGNSAPLTVYVIAIAVDASEITVSATRGGAAADVSAFTVAQSAKCYHPGVLTNGAFTSLKSALLSAANGGSSTLHGVSKLAYPMLQAINVNGSSVTSSNLLDKIFDAYMVVRQKAKGNADTVLMSFKHLGSVMKLLESQKGPFSVTKQPSASIYGWTEIEITTVKGTLKLVGILELDDSEIYFLDKSSMKFYTKGGFKKRMSPDGKEYFEVRATSGYSYIVDSCLWGEMVYLKPGHNAVLHSISY
jgi:hypothetical protein